MSKLLLCLILFCPMAKAGETEDAVQTASLAAFRQSGLEEMLRKFFHDNIPKDIINVGNALIPVVNAGINQKVELTWAY